MWKKKLNVCFKIRQTVDFKEGDGKNQRKLAHLSQN